MYWIVRWILSPSPRSKERGGKGEGKRPARRRSIRRSVLSLRPSAPHAREGAAPSARWALFRQELAAWSRSGLYTWMRTAVVSLVCAAVAGALVDRLLRGGGRVDTTDAARIARATFATFSIAAYVAVQLAVPLLAGGCFTREKEEGTFLLLLASPMPPGWIVVQKFAVQFVLAGSLVVAAFPALLCVLPFGGVAFGQIVLVVAILLVTAALAIAMGIRVSLDCARTGHAVLLAIAFTALLANVPAVVPILRLGAGPYALWAVLGEGGGFAFAVSAVYAAVVAIFVLLSLRRATRRLRAVFTRFEFRIFHPLGRPEKASLLSLRAMRSLDRTAARSLVRTMARAGLVPWMLVLLPGAFVPFVLLKLFYTHLSDPFHALLGVPSAGVLVLLATGLAGYAGVIAGARDRDLGARDLLDVSPIGGAPLLRIRADALAVPAIVAALLAPFIFIGPALRGGGVLRLMIESLAVGGLLLPASLWIGRKARSAAEATALFLLAAAAIIVVPAIFGDWGPLLLSIGPWERAAGVVAVYAIAGIACLRLAERA
ncbi:MAG: hypothetical protein JXP34_11325 [Planctomycetes bacterium]|nr:hypothetical protein [Planctomycetota bacterium]